MLTLLLILIILILLALLWLVRDHNTKVMDRFNEMRSMGRESKNTLEDIKEVLSVISSNVDEHMMVSNAIRGEQAESFDTILSLLKPDEEPEPAGEVKKTTRRPRKK